MTFEIWLAFALASAVVVMIPGPNILLTVNHAVRSGRRSGWATVPGISGGALVGMSVSLAGAGAVLATSATLFALLKFAGALYLIWLAYTLWTAPVTAEDPNSEAKAQRLLPLFAQSFLVSALNPKGPPFYIAFVPQFITADAPIFPQLALLTATFVGVATLNSLFWLLGAASLRQQFQRPCIMRAFNRSGAIFLFAAGLFTARLSRTA